MFDLVLNASMFGKGCIGKGKVMILLKYTFLKSGHD